MIPIKVGLDYGSCSTVISCDGKVIVNEPSLMIVDPGAQKVTAFGQEALAMQGKTPQRLSAVRPLRGGRMLDASAAEASLRHYFRSLSRVRPIFVTAVVSCGASAVERQALAEVIKAAGAAQVSLIEAPLAAAWGAGADMRQAAGIMIAVLGASTIEAAVISMGHCVVNCTSAMPSGTFDDYLSRMLRSEFNLIADETVIESLKINLARAFPEKTPHNMEISAIDVVSGLPVRKVIASDKLSPYLKFPLQHMAELLKGMLRAVPFELSGDLVTNGLLLAGGTASLPDLPEYLQENLHIPVKIANNSAVCPALGASIAASGINNTPDKTTRLS